MWEYLFLTAEKSEDVLLPRLKNGEELEDWKKGISLYEYANQLGGEDWELINITWQAKEHLSLVFKKPVSENSHDQPIPFETGIELGDIKITGRGAAELVRMIKNDND